MNWRFGDRIYVSYVFAALWAGDAAWAWVPGRWQSRPKWLEGAWQAFVAFMVVNGGFVFAAGPIEPIRWPTLPRLPATLIGAWRRLRCRPDLKTLPAATGFPGTGAGRSFGIRTPTPQL